MLVKYLTILFFVILATEFSGAHPLVFSLLVRSMTNNRGPAEFMNSNEFHWVDPFLPVDFVVACNQHSIGSVAVEHSHGVCCCQMRSWIPLFFSCCFVV